MNKPNHEQSHVYFLTRVSLFSILRMYSYNVYVRAAAHTWIYYWCCYVLYTLFSWLIQKIWMQLSMTQQMLLHDLVLSSVKYVVFELWLRRTGATLKWSTCRTKNVVNISHKQEKQFKMWQAIIFLRVSKNTHSFKMTEDTDEPGNAKWNNSVLVAPLPTNPIPPPPPCLLNRDTDTAPLHCYTLVSTALLHHILPL